MTQPSAIKVVVKRSEEHRDHFDPDEEVEHSVVAVGRRAILLREYGSAGYKG